MSIKSNAEVIRDETTAGANTAIRVGGNLVEIADDLIAKQIEIVDNTAKILLKANTSDVVAQNGGSIFHTQSFINTGTVSTNGTSVTGSGTSFTSLMIGSKIIISGEERIISAFVSNTSISVSVEFSTFTNVSFSVFARAIIIDSNGLTQSSKNAVVGFNDNGNESSILRNTNFGATKFGLFIQGNAAFMFENGKFSVGSAAAINFTNNFWNSPTDVKLKRISAGVLEINSGSDGIYRDLLLRNIFSTKSLINTTTDNGVDSQIVNGSLIATTIKTSSFTVATLPSPPAQGLGAIAHVTDALNPTYLGTLTGGGTVKCPVFYNGTNWVSS